MNTLKKRVTIQEANGVTDAKKKKSFTKKLKKAVGWHWSNAKRQVTAEKMIVFSFQLFVELETDKSPS